MTSRHRHRTLIFTSLVACAVVLATVAPPTHATHTGPNSRLLFEAQAGANIQLFSIEPDGSDRTQLTHFRDSSATDGKWARSGNRIVFSRHWQPDGGPGEKLIIYTMNADGSGQEALPRTAPLAVSPTFSPNGQRIIFLQASGSTGGRLMTIDAGGSNLRPAGIPGAGGDAACFLGHTNRIAFIRAKPGSNTQTAIFVADLTHKKLNQITSWGGHTDKIDCSPDGKRIAYSFPAFSEESGHSANVYTMRADGSNAIQLTHDHDGRINNSANAWSPDGTKIAYASNQSGNYQIWTMNSDGTGKKQLTSGPEAHFAAWGRR